MPVNLQTLFCTFRDSVKNQVFLQNQNKFSSVKPFLSKGIHIMDMQRFWVLLIIALWGACRPGVSLNSGALQYVRVTLPYYQVPNVNPNLLSLDVYYDPGQNEKLPVVIWVHGGGWCLGDKANKLQNKKRFLATQRYLLVSVNYRLSPYPYEINNPDRIKFPVHNQDVARAVKWVYENIHRYGGDPEKLVLMGHSAGGHLVTLTAVSPVFLNEVEVPLQAIRGVIAVDAATYDVYDAIQHNPQPEPMLLNAFGNDAAENISASPVYQLNGNSDLPPFLIIKRGSAARLHQADLFTQALRNSGAEVTELNANPYTHAQVNEAIGREGETRVTPVIRDFLKSCFQP